MVSKWESLMAPCLLRFLGVEGDAAMGSGWGMVGERTVRYVGSGFNLIGNQHPPMPRSEQRSRLASRDMVLLRWVRETREGT